MKRLDLLQFLQESATRLRRLAREHPSSPPELLKMADEIAAEAAALEAELLAEGLLDARLRPANRR